MGATGVAAFNAATSWHKSGCECASKYIGSNPHLGAGAVDKLYSSVNDMLRSFGLGGAVEESYKQMGEKPQLIVAKVEQVQDVGNMAKAIEQARIALAQGNGSSVPHKPRSSDTGHSIG